MGGNTSVKYEPDHDEKRYEARRQLYINNGYMPLDTKTDLGKTCDLTKKGSPSVHLTFLKGGSEHGNN
jgi:hypothetical protein